MLLVSSTSCTVLILKRRPLWSQGWYGLTRDDEYTYPDRYQSEQNVRIISARLSRMWTVRQRRSGCPLLQSHTLCIHPSGALVVRQCDCEEQPSSDETVITTTLLEEKVKSIRRPLTLRYPISPSSKDDGLLVCLLQKLLRLPAGLAESFGVPLVTTVRRAVALTWRIPPEDCRYASRSTPIGEHDELVGMELAKHWIMRRLDSESKGTLCVYLHINNPVTSHSKWLYAHVRTA